MGEVGRYGLYRFLHRLNEYLSKQNRQTNTEHTENEIQTLNNAH